MKRIRMVSLLLALCLMTLCSCGEKSDITNNTSEILSSDDPFAVEHDDDFYAYPSYTETTEDDIAELTYYGENVSMTVKIENEEKAFELGFMVFVDGYSVLVSIDNETDNMVKVNFAANESKTVEISFSPVSGKKGDVLSARILSVLEPSYIPTFKSGDATFGHFQSLGYEHFALIKLNETPKATNYNTKSIETVQLTDEIRGKYSVDAETFSKEKYEKAVKNSKLPLDERDPDLGFDGNSFWCFCGFENIGQSNIEIDTKSNIPLNISAMATEETNYRVTVFVNNSPAASVDGYDVVELKTRLEGYNNVRLEYDLNKCGDRALIWAIAIPYGMNEDTDFWEGTIQTSPFVVLF